MEIDWVEQQKFALDKIVPPPDGRVIIGGLGTVVMSQKTYEQYVNKDTSKKKRQQGKTLEELIEINGKAICDDPFECPWGMYRARHVDCYGCLAKYPHGDPKEKDQGCIAEQIQGCLLELKEVRKTHGEGNDTGRA